MYIIELRLIIVIQCKINDMTIYKRGWISMFFKNEEIINICNKINAICGEWGNNR